MNRNNPTPSVVRPYMRRALSIQQVTLCNLHSLFLGGKFKEAAKMVEEAARSGIINIDPDYLYNASLHLVTPLGRTPEARHAPAVCPGPDYLFQYGGVSVSSGKRLSDLWCYNFTLNLWLLLDDASHEDSASSTAPVVLSRPQNPVIAYYDKSVFMVRATEEGTRFLRFDLASKKWSNIICDINQHDVPCPFLSFQIQVDEAKGVIYILVEDPVFAHQSRLFRFSVSDSNWECVLNLQEHPNLASVGRTMVWSASTKCLYFLDGYRLTSLGFGHSSAFRFFPDESTLQGIKACHDGTEHSFSRDHCFPGAFAPDSRSICAIGGCKKTEFLDNRFEFMRVLDCFYNRWENVRISGRSVAERPSECYEQLIYDTESQRVFLVGARLWEMKFERCLEDVVQQLISIIDAAELRERSIVDIDARFELYKKFQGMFTGIDFEPSAEEL